VKLLAFWIFGSVWQRATHVEFQAVSAHWQQKAEQKDCADRQQGTSVSIETRSCGALKR